MAKRGAEALACRAPWETSVAYPPTKRARSEAGPKEPLYGKASGGRGCCGKRKRAGEEEETSGKRPAAVKPDGPEEEPVMPAGSGLWEGTRRQEQSAVLPESDEETNSREASARPWSPKASMAEEHEDDVWQYNSFQYWRPPLPAINLSDILNIEKENMLKTRHLCRAGLSEMET